MICNKLKFVNLIHKICHFYINKYETEYCKGIIINNNNDNLKEHLIPKHSSAYVSVLCGMCGVWVCAFEYLPW